MCLVGIRGIGPGEVAKALCQHVAGAQCATGQGGLGRVRRMPSVWQAVGARVGSGHVGVLVMLVSLYTGVIESGVVTA